MKIMQFIISMLLVSAVIMGIYGFANTLSSEEHYDVNISTQYNDRYGQQKINKLNSTITSLQDSVQNLTPEKDKQFLTGVWDVFQIGKSAIIGTVQGTGFALSTGTDFATEITQDLGVSESNGYITTVLLMILTILIIGAIIYILTGRNI